MKIVNFINSIDLDEEAHNELPHLDLYCLPSSFFSFHNNIAWKKPFLKFCKHKFCLLFWHLRVKVTTFIHKKQGFRFNIAYPILVKLLS